MTMSDTIMAWYLNSQKTESAAADQVRSAITANVDQGNGFSKTEQKQLQVADNLQPGVTISTGNRAYHLDNAERPTEPISLDGVPNADGTTEAPQPTVSFVSFESSEPGPTTNLDLIYDTSAKIPERLKPISPLVRRRMHEDEVLRKRAAAEAARKGAEVSAEMLRGLRQQALARDLADRQAAIDARATMIASSANHVSRSHRHNKTETPSFLRESKGAKSWLLELFNPVLNFIEKYIYDPWRQIRKGEDYRL